jgi:hypothetical protein
MIPLLLATSLFFLITTIYLLVILKASNSNFKYIVNEYKQLAEKYIQLMDELHEIKKK